MALLVLLPSQSYGCRYSRDPEDRTTVERGQASRVARRKPEPLPVVAWK